MKDLIQNAKAVEARLRGYSNTTMNRFGHDGCDVINALIIELEAAQKDAERWNFVTGPNSDDWAVCEWNNGYENNWEPVTYYEKLDAAIKAQEGKL